METEALRRILQSFRGTSGIISAAIFCIFRISKIDVFRSNSRKCRMFRSFWKSWPTSTIFCVSESKASRFESISRWRVVTVSPKRNLLEVAGQYEGDPVTKLTFDIVARDGDEVRFLVSRIAIPTWLSRSWIWSCFVFSKFSKSFATSTTSLKFSLDRGADVSPRQAGRRWRLFFEIVYVGATLIQDMPRMQSDFEVGFGSDCCLCGG